MFTARIESVARHALLCVALAMTVAVLVSSGCSSEPVAPERTAGISGTVTLKGKPVKGGTVMLMSLEDGSSGQAPLDNSGKFEMAEPVPPGEYTVFFAGARVPEIYLSETSSDHKVTVTEGTNDLKIDLQ